MQLQFRGGYDMELEKYDDGFVRFQSEINSRYSNKVKKKIPFIGYFLIMIAVFILLFIIGMMVGS